MNSNNDIKGFLFPYVRFFNASPDAGSIDFYCNNDILAAGIPYGSFSVYIKVSRGMQCFKITKSGSKSDVLAEIKVNFSIGDVYDICAVNRYPKTALYAINEPTERSDTDYGHLRVCNLSLDMKSINIYADNNCFIGDIKYLEISKYVEMIADKYTFDVKNSETGKKILNCGTQIIKQGKYNTLYILSKSEPYADPICVFTIDAASYTGFYL